MKARIRSLKLKKTNEVEDLISSLEVYSRKVEMSMLGRDTLDQVLIQTLDHCMEYFSSVGNHQDNFGDLGDA